MRLSIVWTILRKEIVDSLRDRRTLIMMVGLPVLLYPLIMIGAAKVMESQREAQQARTAKVGVWGAMPEGFAERLAKAGKIDLRQGAGLSGVVRGDFEAGRIAAPKPGAKPAETALTAAARKEILDRRLDVVIVLWPGFADAARAGQLGQVSLMFDSVRQDSRAARERVESAIEAWRKDLVAERVKQRGLDPGFATAVRVVAENVAREERRSGMVLGMILGMLPIFISAIAGFYAAIDLTAGEKERGTMQTLLCAPVSSGEMITGKFLAVCAISLVASLANVLSMAAAMGRMTAGQLEIKLTASALALCFLMLLPVCATTSALFLAVAAFARDFKDGQNYLTPALLVLLLPLYTAAMPFVELNPWTAFIPFVNIALLIKGLFLAEAKADVVFLTLLSSTAYAMLAIQFAGAVFQRETVLLGGGSFKSMFKIDRRRRATPTPDMSLLAFALMLIAGFYGSLALRQAGLTTMMLVMQLGFILTPALALAALFGFSWRETFALRTPTLRAVAGSLLAGASGWAVASASIRLLPPPQSFVEAIRKVLMLDDPSVPMWLVWAVVAVMPAICEELFFRGFVMNGLRDWGKWWALGVSSVLFGLAHASIYRFLPTALLGLLIGYTVWKTGSIFCGMIIHAANNGIATAIAKIEPVSRALDAERMTFLPLQYSLAGAVVLAIALLLISGARPRTPQGSPSG